MRLHRAHRPRRGLRRHGRPFAFRFGADETTVSIWRLIVDGLLTIATVVLWKSDSSGRWPAWLAFAFGISLSLCANIGSAAELSSQWRLALLALLLAVELLNRALKRHRATPPPVNAPSQEQLRTIAHRTVDGA